MVLIPKPELPGDLKAENYVQQREGGLFVPRRELIVTTVISRG